MSKYNDVNKHNITQLLPALKLIIKKSSFIAIDTEFTGLGNQSTKQKDLGQRYESLSEHVSTHALIAFGLSLFIQDKKLSASFKVYNFSFSLLCQTAYKVCPSSMQFLIGNGFDFNQQFSTGIPYRPGNDSILTDNQRNSVSNLEIHELNDAIRQIFNTLVKSKSTLIVHNGLLDLMFLYHSFYAPLPLSINQFVGDLSEMFECIYDTKVCSEYIVRNRSTFLAYLYKKSERDNQLKERFSIDVQNKIPLLPNDMTRESKNLYLNRKRKLDTLNYCGQYATHGHCYQGKACEKSHDLDVILDHHEQQVVEESSKKIKTNLTMNEKTVVLEDTMTLKPEIDHSIKIKSRQEQRPVDDSSFEQYHSASFDAFMTGYIHASQLCQGQAQETKNKVFLMGKDYPLLVKRSVYEKLSEQHIAKMKKMNS